MLDLWTGNYINTTIASLMMGDLSSLNCLFSSIIFVPYSFIEVTIKEEIFQWLTKETSIHFTIIAFAEELFECKPYTFHSSINVKINTLWRKRMQK